MRNIPNEAPQIRPKIAFGRRTIDLSPYFGVGSINQLIKHHPGLAKTSLHGL
jgi:hypothetical protein